MEGLFEGDKRLLEALDRALENPRKFVRLLHAYYADLDRADRTPRDVLYFHLGVLEGMVMRILAER
jgi:hypothetical protein